MKLSYCPLKRRYKLTYDHHDGTKRATYLTDKAIQESSYEVRRFLNKLLDIGT